MRDTRPLPLTRLSQGQLNLLETCPRKFQHIYLEQLNSPIDPEIQERMVWGNQFHQLMQQRELGLPVKSLLAEDDPLYRSVNALVEAAPEVLLNPDRGDRAAESYRTLSFQGYLLTVVYDLLIVNRNNAQIFDWKTYPQPQNATKIATNWQTRLYLFVLAETSDYPPENLSMTYWFVRLPKRPQRLTLPYNRRQHERTREDLTVLLSQLDRDKKRYFEEGIEFPQVSPQKGECDRCHFNRRCHRFQPDNSAIARDWRNAMSPDTRFAMSSLDRFAIAEIEEISL
ncbi:MAG: PD-(D/E)XK nuclease family protein [Cyanobacteriota bacterium]|nr:PD-(D/E)XK nuclease family protein [Cyanobacteriota bacterium]